jgi:hypothetical protein
MGSVKPNIRTESVWAIMVKGLSNRTIPTQQMKPLFVHFELEMALKKVLASPSSFSLLLILPRISIKEPHDHCRSLPDYCSNPWITTVICGTQDYCGRGKSYCCKCNCDGHPWHTMTILAPHLHKNS